jgi:hypothetical protein
LLFKLFLLQKLVLLLQSFFRHLTTQMASAQLEDWSIYSWRLHRPRSLISISVLTIIIEALLASQDNDTADTNETALLLLQ